jgi:hypothetical protein
MAASGSIIYGDKQPKQIALNVSRHPIDGTIYRITYKGEITAMQSAFVQLTNGAVNAELTQNDNIGIITADFKNVAGSQTPIPSTLELQFNEIEKSIFANPYYEALTHSDCLAVTSAWSRAEALTGTDSEQAAELVAIEAALNTGTNAALKLSAYQLGKFDNVRTYKYLQPTITYTRVVWPDYSTAFAIADCGLIYIVPNVPSNLFPWFVLPAVANTIGAPAGSQLGWYKTARATTVADGGIQLVEQYTYDAWPTALYGNPI